MNLYTIQSIKVGNAFNLLNTCGIQGQGACPWTTPSSAWFSGRWVQSFTPLPPLMEMTIIWYKGVILLNLYSISAMCQSLVQITLLFIVLWLLIFYDDDNNKNQTIFQYLNLCTAWHFLNQVFHEIQYLGLEQSLMPWYTWRLYNIFVHDA